MSTDFDIAICGAGPVGLALAALLIRQGTPASSIALIDARTAERSAHDPRSIALSWGSRQLLASLDAWPAAATPIEQIHVSRHGHFGRTLIDHKEYHLPALGYVLRYGAIVAQLESQLTNSGIHMIRPVTMLGISETDSGASIIAHDHAPIQARLVIKAEGGIFGEQERKQLHRDYQQTAIVAHVTSDTPIPYRAFERFCDEGPLALLPQDDGYALVWCVQSSTAQRLLSLDDQSFLRELCDAFGGRLGRFVSTSARNAFPLGLNASSTDSEHIIAVGNAAQTLHPVAGQGLNLGLRDARILASLLTERTEYGKVSERFARIRNRDRNFTIRLTDIMARIFTSSGSGALPQTLLGLSLGLLDGIPPARKLLAEQMMFGQRP